MSITSELTNYSNLLATAYDKTEDKGATIPDNKNLQNLANAIDSIPEGGGDVVNGIIKEYYAYAEDIDANTFVEFVNIGLADKSLSTSYYSGENISAVLIDTNKVFIVHCGHTEINANVSYRYLYGTVCTISGTTIAAGVDTRLSTISCSGYRQSSVVLLDAGKVFIAHGSSNSGKDSYLYGMVCTISGTTITVGKDTRLSSSYFSGDYSSAIFIDTNKVFIAHICGSSTDSSSAYLYGMVCTISGTTITAETDTQLSTISYASTANYIENREAVLIDTNKVFIAYSAAGANSNARLYGTVCTISGTTITAGVDTQLSTDSHSGRGISAVLVGANKVFIVHITGDTTRLCGLVCTISGVVIAAGTDTRISSLYTRNASTAKSSVVWLDTNKVFVVYSASNSSSTSSNTYLYGTVCAISSTTIDPGTDTLLSNTRASGTYNSTVLIGTNRAFIAHGNYISSNSYYNLYGAIVTPFPTVRKTTSSTIQGLTRDRILSNGAGPVWVLDR